MDSVLVVMLLAYHFGYDKHGDREILDLQLVTQARLSVDRFQYHAIALGLVGSGL